MTLPIDRGVVGSIQHARACASCHTRGHSVHTPARNARRPTSGMRSANQTALVHARHLRAAAGMISLHSGHSFVGGPGAAGAGFRMAFVIMKTQRAMITKSTMFPRNAP